MKRFALWLGNLLNVRTVNPDLHRRGHLLGILILTVIAATLATAVFNLVGYFLAPAANPFSFFFSDLIVVVFFAGLLRLNQLGKTRLAGVIFLVGLILSESFLFTADALSYVLLIYAIPIVAASFVLSPASPFFFAWLSATSYTLVFLTSAPSVQYNYVAIIGLFVMALFAWLAATNIENALREVSKRAQELDQRVHDRTADLLDRAKEMEALYKTSLEINSQLDVPQLLESIIARAARLVGTQAGILYLMRSDSQTLEPVVRHNLPDYFRGVTLRLGEGLAGRVAQTGQPMAIDDYLHWEGRAAGYASSPFRRVLGVPLQVRNQVIGVVTINDDIRTGPFSEDEIRLVSLFADQAAIAIENARLLQAEREQRDLAETMREISSTLASTLDLDATLEHILQQVSRVVPNDAAGILLVEGDRARIVRWRSPEQFNPQLWSPDSFLIAGTQYLSQMQATGRPVIMPDMAAAPRWIGVPGLDWLRALAGVPICVRGTVIAFLVLGSSTPGLFTPAPVERLLLFADQAAIAIENARLYRAEQEQRQLAQTLREVGALLVSTLDTHSVLDRILEQVSRVTPNDAADIMLIKDDNIHLVRWRGYEQFGTPDPANVAFSIAQTHNLQHMIETGEPVVIRDVHAEPGWIPAPGIERLRSYAGVPIRARGETIGFLAVYSILPGHFEQPDADKLRAFADQAAIAWENARLFEDARRTAERLQVLSHRMVQVQEDERRSIARELHDEIGQTLTAVKINLQTLQRSLDAPGHAAVLEENVHVVERALQQVRNLSLNLRPSLLDDLGLVPALRWYVTRQAERAGFTAAFAAGAVEAHLSPTLEIACFRVVQEALTNVMRHAGAQHVLVELRQHDAELELTIRDDGVGFDVQSALERAMHGASLGLLGMDERVSLVGGQMEIESVPMRGTEIRARFPLALPSSKAQGLPVD